MPGTANDRPDFPASDSGDSLLRVSVLYRRRADGTWQYDGARPGPDWHAHGYFPRLLLVVVGGALARVVVWKRRWRHVETGRTCHSRPPDDPPRLMSSSLVVATLLWAWLAGGAGLQHAQDRLPHAAGSPEWPSERTLLRWLHRCCSAALAIQQAVRLAILEKSEPRPVERLFPGGLPPPAELLRRRWQDPPLVDCLWRALALAWHGAPKLSTPVAILLAEARGRWEGPLDCPIP